MIKSVGRIHSRSGDACHYMPTGIPVKQGRKRQMGIVGIKKNNIGEQVYSQMRNQIMKADWKPGEKIPSENQLIQLFGVSRGTVRQAMQRLSGEGLIETRHGEGSFVKVGSFDNYIQPPTPICIIGSDEIKKIFEFRKMFESGVAEVAALKATQKQIGELEANYERMKAQSNVFNAFVQYDLEFHMLLCECTQNTLAIQVFNSYEGLLGPSILNMTSTIGVENGIMYHGLILDAVKKNDPEKARITMAEHMVGNLEKYSQYSSIWGADPIDVAMK